MNNNITIAQLRKSGFKVRVTHFRYHSENGQLLPQRDLAAFPEIISPKGGKTLIEIRTPAGHEFKGESFCSRKDTFNRKMGNSYALNRAIISGMVKF